MIKELKKNDEIEIEIEDISVDGSGIGHYEGMAVFIPGAVPGDLVRAGITKVRKNILFARLISIIKPSKDRVDPPCRARQCGGCQLQELSYEKQLEWKENQVRSDLIRIGGFSPEEADRVMRPIIGMESPVRYRNKAQYPVGWSRDNKIVSGFYARRSHRIIPVEDCILGDPRNQNINRAVISFMEKYGIQPYDELNHTGLIRHILIRTAHESGQIMVCLIINGDRLDHEKELVKALKEAEPSISSISFNINKRRDNVILGEKTVTIYGSGRINDSIGDVRFSISPQSFFQVNPFQTEKLYSKALEYASLTGREVVWDLYCGAGTISLFLARHAKKVYGIEIVPEAVRDAIRNAEMNGIDNAAFFTGRVEDVLPDFYANAGRRAAGAICRNATIDEAARHPDVIVVDPPRKGLDEKCLSTMIEMKPDRIVYVSCNPSTLARDLAVLTANGYELREVTPVDQFGLTVHVETVALLIRQN